jgi:thiosulfate dehydrogenase
MRPAMISSVRISSVLPALLLIAVLARGQEQVYRPADSALSGPLISSRTGMETAWDLPKNPLLDSLPTDSHLAGQIVRGYRIFTNTPRGAPRFTGNALSCNNCHLNAGQREKAMPLVGVAGVFPEYSKRAGRELSLEDRIVGCFLRSENAFGARGASGHEGDGPVVPDSSEEVLALASYISWISGGYGHGSTLPWRGQNTIPSGEQIPIGKLNPKRGETLFRAKCTSCHGKDGQGVEIGDKKAGPLWGARSWNDGAGAARIYTLAGMILYMMPYLDTGSLTAEEAQQISAYINSKPRPLFPHKERDYPSGQIPPDAIYYNGSPGDSLSEKK